MPPEFSEVKAPWWNDRPTLIVGCGSSLKGFDFSQLRGLGYILAVKQAVWDVSFADACFGLDLPWMKRCRNELSQLTVPLYLAVPPGLSEKQYTHIPNAVYLERLRVKNKLSDDPRKIESGGNSGFGAFNFAILKRAKRIYLFGYDYSSSGGHYCPERYDQPQNHNARYWPRWGDNFFDIKDQIAVAGVTVVNASPNSTLKAFPKVTLEQAIANLRGLRPTGG